MSEEVETQNFDNGIDHGFETAARPTRVATESIITALDNCLIISEVIVVAL